ncbi:hypothetical protein DYBT9623_05445 [Dyadobacter sp. CECT 9623]|uniref:Uncharacterized protein n=1 Tax=Dyadobacter linearis TaxID=2823330 RepID=A0ABM8UYL0_9BACT|nr:hypothetical protein [Dyadobacter sp. CECT 9623]CAG5074757.1 hypothetical protein DYBT9623_05445 [Dyadobacter sp. CECT 9623]
MKILTTNWINILGVFIAMLLYSIIFNQLNNDLGYNIFQSIVGSLILICLYGMMFWGLFVVSLIVADLLLIVWDQKHLRQKLLIEWLIISSPAIYRLIKYQEWIFLVGIVAFFITQLLREKLIVKAMSI